MSGTLVFEDALQEAREVRTSRVLMKRATGSAEMLRNSGGLDSGCRAIASLMAAERFPSPTSQITHNSTSRTVARRDSLLPLALQPEPP